MRILFIVPYVPTPIRVRPYNLIKSLVARGHRLTLATLWTTPEEREGLAELESLGVRVISEPLSRRRSLWNCLRALPTPMPLQAVYCRSPRLRATVESELYDEDGVPSASYDIVHVEHLRGAYYGLRLEGVPIVWDSVDCISYLFEQAARDSRSLSGRWMTRFDLERTRHYEGWLVGHFDRVLVTSQADKLALEDLAAESGSLGFPHTDGSPVTILPNGVDLAYFSPSGGGQEPDSVVITGKMSYHANVSAALHLVRDIMPLVWEQRPQVKLYIVGANPPRQIRQLAEGPGGRIEVTGTVPDLRPYLWRASVAVAPLVYGAGTQYKILEAMATTTPVVTTLVGARGLGVVDDEHLLVRSDPREFARAILRLLGNHDLAARLSLAGRRYVEEHHDWNVVGAKLEDIYREVMAQRKPQEQERTS